jgi:hypothetical protein
VRVFNEATVVGSVLRELRDAGLAVIVVRAATPRRRRSTPPAPSASHPASLGAGGALQTGLGAALAFTDAEYIPCFDADGQHQVPDLWE